MSTQHVTLAATTPSIRHPRILLTGAAGNVGRWLRPRLRPHCAALRVSDLRADLGPAEPGEELCPANLADRTAVFQLLEGVSAVVHLGGASTEVAWEDILAANIDGLVNLYEAARRQGTRRIIFASSNHVTGCYRQDEVIRPADPVRPDGFYGVSKAFGENLAQMYWDRHGLETVSLRIGSALPAPENRRHLATWLSPDDTERLVVAALNAPVVRHSIVFGRSANAGHWWDNTPAAHLGYQPQDSSESHRAALQAGQAPLNPRDPADVLQGGHYLHLGPTFKRAF